jgi:SAM-dependent methyltransferase
MGLLHHHLEALGEALYGTEVALTPLAAARRPGVRPVLCDSGLPFADRTFDLVLTVSVLHHVPPVAWPGFLREMTRVARDGGLVVVFEHNPWNPATRWVVSRCAFDRDAVLISPRRLRGLLREAGLTPVLRRHLLTTPWQGRFFAAVDRSLGWLPLGAQYFFAAVPRGRGDEAGGARGLRGLRAGSGPRRSAPVVPLPTEAPGSETRRGAAPPREDQRGRPAAGSLCSETWSRKSRR